MFSFCILIKQFKVHISLRTHQMKGSLELLFQFEQFQCIHEASEGSVKKKKKKTTHPPVV